MQEIVRKVITGICRGIDEANTELEERGWRVRMCPDITNQTPGELELFGMYPSHVSVDATLDRSSNVESMKLHFAIMIGDRPPAKG